MPPCVLAKYAHPLEKVKRGDSTSDSRQNNAVFGKIYRHPHWQVLAYQPVVANFTGIRNNPKPAEFSDRNVRLGGLNG
jgi:hypothetical protein